MKNNNAIFFTLKLTDNTDYYCMLLTALHSLYSCNKHRNYDIVIYYDIDNNNCHNIQINQMCLMFPDIILIHKPWKDSSYYPKIPNPNYFYKWLCLEHIIHNTTYKQLAYFDCDVFFVDNISHIFDKYNKDFYGLYEGYDELKMKLIGTPYAMCSGQFILKRNSLLDITNLFQQVLDTSKYLSDNIKFILNNHPNCPWIQTLMEQYAGHKVLLDNNINLNGLDTRDISFGSGTCDIAINHNQIQIINSITKIIHYTRKNAAIFVLPQYRNENLENEFDRQVINHNLCRNLWE